MFAVVRKRDCEPVLQNYKCEPHYRLWENLSDAEDYIRFTLTPSSDFEVVPAELVIKKAESRKETVMPSSSFFDRLGGYLLVAFVISMITFIAGLYFSEVQPVFSVKVIDPEFSDGTGFLLFASFFPYLFCGAFPRTAYLIATSSLSALFIPALAVLQPAIDMANIESALSSLYFVSGYAVIISLFGLITSWLFKGLGVTYTPNESSQDNEAASRASQSVFDSEIYHSVKAQHSGYMERARSHGETNLEVRASESSYHSSDAGGSGSSFD